MEKEESRFAAAASVLFAAQLSGAEPRPSRGRQGADESPATFMGFILGELLRVSDPYRTYYIPHLSQWVDRNGASALAPGTLYLLTDCLGVVATRGLDRLLAHRALLAVSSLAFLCKCDLAG